MIEVTGFDHIVLRSPDVERLVSFYIDVIGLPAERLDEFRAGRVPFPSLRVTPDTLIDIFPARTPSDPSAANLEHFCLVIADLEVAKASLLAAGLEIETPDGLLFGARGHARSLYFRDPDGNRVELRAYPE
jgi:catechol 2,3-dioxygenase-like lactoylglutathione lyase family enzyme